MKPWLEDESWFADYAQRIVQLKGLDRAYTPSVETAIKNSFFRVYRAVAFDIDGTLTVEEGITIDSTMAEIIAQLLRRGVPVILITGRGRSSTREAAREIRQLAGLSTWQLRRLQCVTHNGALLLYTPEDNPEAFLAKEEVIGPLGIPPADLEAEIARAIDASEVADESVSLTQEPESVRMTFRNTAAREQLQPQMERLVAKHRDQTTLYLSRGAYGNSSCLDIAGTNKRLAVERIASNIGVSPERILRIGDQGQDGGNDYDLLASSAGFCVGEISREPQQCFPVLDQNGGQLTGAEATDEILSQVLLFAPLSIRPTEPTDDSKFKTLRQFERLALRRSAKETDTVNLRLRLRLRYLLADEDQRVNPLQAELSDIYDLLSGAVKFRDWELDYYTSHTSIFDLFDIPDHPVRIQREPESAWSMYTDTGLILRGPHYYFGYTQTRSHDSLPDYLEESRHFITKSIEVISDLQECTPDFGRFKFVLGIQDNIRNILLQLFYAAYVLESEKSNPLYLTTRIFQDGVLPHTRHHFHFLFKSETSWIVALKAYHSLLQSLDSLLSDFEQSLAELTQGLRNSVEVFKWRECDNFVQNVTAIQLAVHEFIENHNLESSKNLPIVVGLAYGGLELPAIAITVGAEKGLNFDAGFMKLSIYSGTESVGVDRHNVREATNNYVNDYILTQKEVHMLTSDRDLYGNPIILMDDNCTTGVTLQLARDTLVVQGGDVLGAIIVRFPGINRHVHMALEGHGFPDPEILFNFIRGLVAPSPYTRLLYPAQSGTVYLDQTGVFNKSKARIEKYLKKNGTPISD